MTLEISKLSKSYGTKRALKEVSFTLTPGVYGLLGPNGAGKSTLMNIITGNLHADSGKITYDGNDIIKMGAAFRKILGYMPQQQGLYDTFTAKRFLYYIAALKGLKKAQAKQQIENAIKLVNLQDCFNKRLSTFSGGMKQRILIAQAIIGNPQILIFDEPTAGLDPKERIRIRNLIAEIALDKIVIVATHVVSDIEYIAKEIILLKDGKVIEKKEPVLLLDYLTGKVFEITAAQDKLTYLSSKFQIGNISKGNDQITVRVVSPELPKGFEYREVAPTLEDVYLYLFEDEVVIPSAQEQVLL